MMRQSTLAGAAFALVLACGMTAAGAQQSPNDAERTPDVGRQTPNGAIILHPALQSGTVPDGAETTGQGGMGQRMMGHGMMGNGMMGNGMMGMGGHEGGRRAAPVIMRVMFALMDTDGDGTVELPEFQAAHERIFKAMDANKDGKLTFEEMQAFFRGRPAAPPPQ